MADNARRKADPRTAVATKLPTQLERSPEIAAGVARLYARYGKYALPPAELRAIVDKEMGDKTLTEALYEMREG